MIPGVSAAIHAHFMDTTFLSFDTREHQMFLRFMGTDAKGREEYLFHPVDLFGSFGVGGVEIGSYFQPVGSAPVGFSPFRTCSTGPKFITCSFSLRAHISPPDTLSYPSSQSAPFKYTPFAPER